MSQPIKALILDMDGVLWRADQPIGNLPRIFQRIAEMGLSVALATNNATRTPQEYLQKLSRFGVAIDPAHIVTAAMATGRLLAAHFPDGGNVYVVGQAGLRQAVQSAGFHVPPPDELPDEAVAVAAGLDTAISYRKLTCATLLIRRGVPFYGSNPDLTYPVPEGQAPGAGAILAAIQAATGVKPIIAGKPETPLFELALQRLGVRAKEALMVGDRPETDILGGQRAGLRTALVLSGVCTSAQAAAVSPPPDWIAADLSALLDILEQEI